MFTAHGDTAVAFASACGFFGGAFMFFASRNSRWPRAQSSQAKGAAKPAAAAAKPKGKSSVRVVGPVSRSASYRRQRLYLKLKGGKKPAAKKERKAPVVKEAKFYPAYDEPKPLPSRRTVSRPAVVRPSIVPGAVVILLAGKYRGKRVVVVKVLPSGLALVSGPYRLNGVPLRRVNPAYVIATSTRVDVTGLKLADKFTDAYFTKPAAKKEQKKKGDEAIFTAAKTARVTASAAQRQDQRDVDAQLLASIKKTPLLAAYLRAPFTLSRNDLPHKMKF